MCSAQEEWPVHLPLRPQILPAGPREVVEPSHATRAPARGSGGEGQRFGGTLCVGERVEAICNVYRGAQFVGVVRTAESSRVLPYFCSGPGGGTRRAQVWQWGGGAEAAARPSTMPTSLRQVQRPSGRLQGNPRRSGGCSGTPRQGQGLRVSCSTSTVEEHGASSGTRHPSKGGGRGHCCRNYGFAQA